MKSNWWALALALTAACHEPKAPVAKPGPAPKLAPLTGLFPASGLTWLVTVTPHVWFEDARFTHAFHRVIAEDRWRAFTRRHGVDPLLVDEVVFAMYRGAFAAAVRGPLDTGRLEQGFGLRAEKTLGRSIDRTPEQMAGGLTRLWGRARGEDETLLLFANQGAVITRGSEPLHRAMTLFAEGRLKRAKPALEAPPLDVARRRMGGRPFAAYAPGPFAGEWTRGIAGLLAGATAAGIACEPGAETRTATIKCTLHLFGEGWQDASEARLGAWFDTWATEPLGRLCGLHEPTLPVKVSRTVDALLLEVGWDADRLARGLHDAVEASAAEIMAD